MRVTLDFLSRFSMENCCAVIRYKWGRVLFFTVMTSWESFLVEICERWALEVSRAKVTFITLDAHRKVCIIEPEVDFQHMYHIFHMFNCTTVNLIVNTDERSLVVSTDTSLSL